MADKTTTLRSRCAAFLSQAKIDALLRQGSPVDDLMAFVIAETGRKADRRMEQSLPLCLYFSDDAAREEFIALWHEGKPNSISKRLP
jgi:hypothetical protein